MTTYQQPDGTPKNTGATLHESIARVRIDDHESNSRYTIHVEHPSHNGGTNCFWRGSRESVARGIRKHLDNWVDSDLARVDVVDEAGLGLDEPELLPDSYKRTGPFAPETPSVQTVSHVEDDA